MVNCVRCGELVHDLDVQACTVTPQEAREFPRQMRAGDVVCAACFHRIKWPSMAPDRRADDDDDPFRQSME
jgi:hypothetical protein